MEAETARRSQTSSMPMSSLSCTISVSFRKWIQSPGGGGKGPNQSSQITSKVLKYFKFCCSDVVPTWDLPDAVADYCIGSMSLISDFVELLQNEWKACPWLDVLPIFLIVR